MLVNFIKVNQTIHKKEENAQLRAILESKNMSITEINAVVEKDQNEKTDEKEEEEVYNEEEDDEKMMRRNKNFNYNKK